MASTSVKRARSFAPATTLTAVTGIVCLDRVVPSELIAKVDERARALAAVLAQAMDACNTRRAVDAEEFCIAASAHPVETAVSASIDSALTRYWCFRAVALDALTCAMDRILEVVEDLRRAASSMGRADMGWANTGWANTGWADVRGALERVSRDAALWCLPTLKESVLGAWTPMLSGLEAAGALDDRRCPALLAAYDDCETHSSRTIVGPGPVSDMRTGRDATADAWVLVLMETMHALAFADASAGFKMYVPFLAQRFLDDELAHESNVAVTCAACLIHPRWFVLLHKVLPRVVAIKSAHDASPSTRCAEFENALRRVREAASNKRLRKQFKEDVALLHKAGAPRDVIRSAKLLLVERYANAKYARKLLTWGWTVLQSDIEPTCANLHRERVALDRAHPFFRSDMDVVRRHCRGVPRCRNPQDADATRRRMRRGDVLNLQRLADACTRSGKAATELDQAVVEVILGPVTAQPWRPCIYDVLGGLGIHLSWNARAELDGRYDAHEAHDASSSPRRDD
jgi:hypothetical protein